MTKLLTQEERFGMLISQIPFLETLNDPIVERIINILKDETKHILIDLDRLNQIEMVIQKYTKAFKDKKNIKTEMTDKSKNATPKVIAHIVLESSEDEDQTKDKKFDSSSSDEIQFFKVNNSTLTTSLPKPRKIVKKKFKEENPSSSDSDLEIISIEHPAKEKPKSENSDTKSVKDNDENLLFTRREVKESIIVDNASEKAETTKELSDKNEKCNEKFINLSKIKNSGEISTNKEKVHEQKKQEISNFVIKKINLKKKLNDSNSETNIFKRRKEELTISKNKNSEEKQRDSVIKVMDKSEVVKSNKSLKVNEVNPDEVATKVISKESKPETPNEHIENTLETKSVQELKEIGLDMMEKLGLLPSEEKSQLENSASAYHPPVPVTRDPRLARALNQNNGTPLAAQHLVSSPSQCVSFVQNPLMQNNSLPFPSTVGLPIQSSLQVQPVGTQQVIPIVNPLYGSNGITNLQTTEFDRLKNNEHRASKPNLDIIPPAPPYSKNEILNALPVPNQTSIPDKVINKFQQPQVKYTRSNNTYGQFRRKRQEAKIAAERDAYERGVREAQSLGLPVPSPSANINLKENRNGVTSESKTIELQSPSRVDSGGVISKVVEEPKEKISPPKLILKLKRAKRRTSSSNGIKGLSSSEDESEIVTSHSSTNDKDLAKEHSLTPEPTPQLDNNRLRAKVITALKDQLSSYLSETLLSRIDYVVNSVITKDEDEVLLKTICENNDVKKTTEKSQPQKIGKYNRRKSIATENLVTNNSNELRKLQEQINSYHDKDEIISAVGKRSSFKRASEKIKKNMKINGRQSDDEPCKASETHPNSSSIVSVANEHKRTLLKRRKSCYLERPRTISCDLDHMNTHLVTKELCKVSEKESKESEMSDDQKEASLDEDTDDFTSHIIEQGIRIVRNPTTAKNSKSVIVKQKDKLFTKDLQIKIKRFKKIPESDKVGENSSIIKTVPVLKPLTTIPASTAERKTVKTYKKTKDFKNIDLKHHCYDKEFMQTCVLCKKGVNDAVSHYVHVHGNATHHEAVCARLPSEIIRKFKDETMIGHLRQSHPIRYEVECIFCGKNVIGFHSALEQHYATHTGEYAFKCKKCDQMSAFKRDMIEHCKSACVKGATYDRLYVYKKENRITASFCVQCNFIQLNKANVIRHLQKHHMITKDPEKYCANLTLIKFEKIVANAGENDELLKQTTEEKISENIGQSVEMALKQINEIKHENDETICIANEAADIAKETISDNEMFDSEPIDIKPTILDEIDDLMASIPDELIEALESPAREECFVDDIEIKIQSLEQASEPEPLLKPDEIEIKTELECNDTGIISFDNEVIYVDSSEDETKSVEEAIQKENEVQIESPNLIDCNITSIPSTTVAKEKNVEKLKRPKDLFSLRTKCLLKPWSKTDLPNRFSKEEENEILSEINLSNFYKCTLCSYSTDNTSQMLDHYKGHTSADEKIINPDYECSYCSVVLPSTELIEHIQLDHKCCNYQCSRCFYRSRSSFSVRMHIAKYHKKSNKIIACEGADISPSEQFENFLKFRKEHFKPIQCHLCSGKPIVLGTIYTMSDYESHFKNLHTHETFCKCDRRSFISCIYCHFETNKIDTIRFHIADKHPNEEQFAAARFNNPKYKKNTATITPSSAVIVVLSDIIPEKYYLPTKTLTRKLQIIYDLKKMFRISASDAEESVWNSKYLENELTKIKDLSNICSEPDIKHLEIYQDEFYAMAQLATSGTGLSGKNLYKCLLKNCLHNFELFEDWLSHVNNHPNLRNTKQKCPHCNEIIRVSSDFNDHFNNKHATLNQYFCYLCPTTDPKLSGMERHQQEKHGIWKRWKKKMILPCNKYPISFIAVIPYVIFCNIISLTFHMRNVLKEAGYLQKANNCLTKPETTVCTPDTETTVLTPTTNTTECLLPKYISLDNQRFRCPEDSCLFLCNSELNLEDHFKNFHRFVRSFKCLHCSFSIEEELRSFDRIKNHLRMHAEIIYACTNCDFIDHQRQIVQKHIRADHKLQLNLTKIQRSERKGAQDFTFETTMEEGYIFLSHTYCLICGFQLNDPEGIIKHMSTKHSVSILYECQYCKSSHACLDDVISHINETHDKVLKIGCKFKYEKRAKNDELSEKNHNDLKNCSDSIKITTRTDSQVKRTYTTKRCLEKGSDSQNMPDEENEQQKKIKNYSTQNCKTAQNCDQCEFATDSVQLLQAHKPSEHKINVHAEENVDVAIHDPVAQDKSSKSESKEGKTFQIRVKPLASLIDPSLMVPAQNENLYRMENLNDHTNKPRSSATSITDSSISVLNNHQVNDFYNQPLNALKNMSMGLKHNELPAKKSEDLEPVLPQSKTFEFEHSILYKCNHCATNEFKINRLFTHWQQYHSSELKFEYNVVFLMQCAFCNLQAPFPQLKYHFQTVHMFKDLVLRKPTYNSTAIQCTECDATRFSTIAELIKHFNQVHATLSKCKRSESDKFTQILFDIIHKIGYRSNKTKCYVCAKEFSDPNACRKHFSEHHQATVFRFPWDQEYPIIKCKMCKVSVQTLRNGITHFYKTHAKAFKCLYCTSSFNQLQQLEDHNLLAHCLLHNNHKHLIVNESSLEYELYCSNLLWYFPYGLVASTYELRKTHLVDHKDLIQMMIEICPAYQAQYK